MFHVCCAFWNFLCCIQRLLSCSCGVWILVVCAYRHRVELETILDVKFLRRLTVVYSNPSGNKVLPSNNYEIEK